MRNAINNLQSTFSGFGYVNQVGREGGREGGNAELWNS